MKIAVIDLDNTKVGEVSLNAEIYQQEFRPDILHKVVEWQRAKRRAGTHKTKGISDVSGTTKKPYAQKGTGNARQGSLRSPQFRGGGIIFGPVVRDHGYSMQKKVRKLALKVALSSKVAENKFIVLDNLKVDSSKTKDLSKQLANIGIKSGLVIGVDEAKDTNFIRAYKNIKHIDTLPTAAINVYDILKHEHLVLTRDAVSAIDKRLGSNSPAPELPAPVTADDVAPAKKRVNRVPKALQKNDSISSGERPERIPTTRGRESRDEIEDGFLKGEGQRR